MKRKTKQGKEIEFQTSWDDGCVSDLRLEKLLRQYNIPTIFYIPVNKKELSDHDVKYLSKSFEIGSHTINHRILRDIHPDECYCELKDSKEYLENLIGKPVNSLCYPRGRYNQNVISIARDLGYKEARTTKVLNLFMPTNPFEIITSIHVYNRKEYNGIYWYDIAMDLFDKVIKTETKYNYFHLWGHSWEVAKYNYWNELELFLSYANENL